MYGTRQYFAICLVFVVFLLGGCFNKQAPLNGTLLVVYPKEYSVQVDGHTSGTTNKPIGAIPAGQHTVSLVAQNETIWNDQVYIVAGETLTIKPQVVSEPTPQPNPAPTPEPTPEPAPQPDVPDPRPVDTAAYAASLVADFAELDALPETLIPQSRWDSYGKYGPPAAEYPAPTIPLEYDSLQWKRDRVVAVAKKYIGKVPYAHKHIPSLGLDCSNFTAWVYNYGLGIKFTSSVTKQGETVGRKLGSEEPLQPGDLLYFQNSAGTITHAAIYIEPGYMIDESGDGVTIKRFPYGWTKTAFAHARRVLE